MLYQLSYQALGIYSYYCNSGIGGADWGLAPHNSPFHHKGFPPLPPSSLSLPLGATPGSSPPSHLFRGGLARCTTVGDVAGEVKESQSLTF